LFLFSTFPGIPRALWWGSSFAGTWRTDVHPGEGLFLYSPWGNESKYIIRMMFTPLTKAL